jgi:hypothetical protein
MKFLVILTLALVLTLSLRINQAIPEKENTPGTTSTDGKAEQAISYAYGSNGGYTLKNPEVNLNNSRGTNHQL